MSKMTIAKILKNFWSILNNKERVIFCAIIPLLVFAGASEMFGMIIIYSYISIVTNNKTSRLFNLLSAETHQFITDADPAMIAVIGGALMVSAFVLKNAFILTVDYILQKFLMRQYYKIISTFTKFLLHPNEIGLKNIRIEKVWMIFNRGFKPALQIILAFILAITISTFLLLLKWNLALIVIAPLALACISIHYISKNIQTALVTSQQDLQNSAKQSFRILKDANTDIQFSATQNYFINKYLKAEKRRTNINRYLTFIRQLPASINEIILSIIIASSMAFFIASGLDISGIVISTLAVFAYAGLRLSRLFSKIIVHFQHIHQGKNEFDAVSNNIEAMANYIQNNENKDNVKSDNRKIQFKNKVEVSGLHFCYPSQNKKEIISNLNLKIYKGEFIGIYGPSGAGKTTLIDLLSGILITEKGTISCDELSIDSNNLREWQSKIGLVTQNPYILKGSIAENIAFGIPKSKIDLARVKQILKDINMHDFVTNLPKQHHFILEGTKKKFSQGQLQRIGLARALYRKTEILLIDEGLSGLETSLQNKIFKTLKSQSYTIINVTHRLELMNHADKVYKLENNHLVGA